MVFKRPTAQKVSACSVLTRKLVLKKSRIVGEIPDKVFVVVGVSFDDSRVAGLLSGRVGVDCWKTELNAF